MLDDADLLGDRAATAATSVLTLAGIDAEPLRSREHVLVSTLFVESWKAGRDLDLAGLIAAVQHPPIQRVGVMDLEAFFPASDRFATAMQLNQLLAAPTAAWLQGDALDLDTLLYTADGRPRVAVVSIAHLDDHARMFFVTLLLNQLVGWMRAQRGTSSLRALVYFDEIFGFLPPVANPPSKAPLLKLLKQARAFGIGLTLATQNPVDLDYKALSNCGTWMLGRLQTERDKARVLDGLEGVAASSGEGFDRAGLDQLLSSLGKRIFLLHNVHEKRPVLFETRWTLSYLRGPMGRDEIRRLAGAAPQASAPSAPSAPSAASAPSAPSAALSPSAPSVAPVLPPAIRQFFIGGAVPLTPWLLGVARLAYADARLGLDETRTITVVAPLGDGVVAADWEHAEPADFRSDDWPARRPRRRVRAAAGGGAAEELRRLGEGVRAVGRPLAGLELRSPRQTGVASPTRASATSGFGWQAPARDATRRWRRCARSTPPGCASPRTSCAAPRRRSIAGAAGVGV